MKSPEAKHLLNPSKFDKYGEFLLCHLSLTIDRNAIKSTFVIENAQKNNQLHKNGKNFHIFVSIF